VQIDRGKGVAMAVIVEFVVPGATPNQMLEVEGLTRARGEAAGRPPYTGCMFLAVTSIASGYRVLSAWRTDADFYAVLETMMGPDLAIVGLAVTDIQVSAVVSMAIPGAL
jgi:hypothetical protein